MVGAIEGFRGLLQATPLAPDAADRGVASWRHRATARQYWFQHDGAPPHVTKPVMDFLHSKFGDQVISRKSEHP